MNYPLRTIQEDGDAAHRSVVILDQTRLPGETAFVRLASLADAAQAIRIMQVRGAPLIGATAAYGVALGLQEGQPLDTIITTLAATRPTAINLRWALDRMARVLQKSAHPKGTSCGALAGRREVAWTEARAIAREDEAANAAIGQHGLALLRAIAARKQRMVGDRPSRADLSHNPEPALPANSSHPLPQEGRRGEEVINVMTHCNAGWLATVAHGTALAPTYAAQAASLDVHVWVSETRPRNQGLLTAWELAQAGIPHTFIADNAAGLLMMRGKVDCVIVGADRIAANGDTANKVGTYLKALAAQAHGVPFYVAAPVSTIDFACPEGAQIPIEERAAEEFALPGMPVANPAFDVTPAGLIAGIITEHGTVAADRLSTVRL